MTIHLHLILAALLLGIGIASALSKRNIISIMMGIVTAVGGALVCLAAIDRTGDSNPDGTLFAVCLASILLVHVVIGSALVYRRYISSGQTNINEHIELRH